MKLAILALVICCSMSAFAQNAKPTEPAPPTEASPPSEATVTEGDPSALEALAPILQALLGAISELLINTLQSTCKHQLALYEYVYYIVDCVLELARLDICSVSYDCQRGVASVNSTGNSSAGVNNGTSQDLREKDKRNANLLILVVQEVVNILFAVFNAAPLILCPADRFPAQIGGKEAWEVVCAKGAPEPDAEAVSQLETEWQKMRTAQGQQRLDLPYYLKGEISEVGSSTEASTTAKAAA